MKLSSMPKIKSMNRVIKRIGPVLREPVKKMFKKMWKIPN